MTPEREKEIRDYVGAKCAGGLMTTEQHYLADMLAEIDGLRTTPVGSLWRKLGRETAKLIKARTALELASPWIADIPRAWHAAEWINYALKEIDS